MRFFSKWARIIGNQSSVIQFHSHCPQSDADDSFSGGVPKLPPEHQIPTCRLCGSQQTFFFQIALPPMNSWVGLTLAVFACTSCAHEDARIPQMLTGKLSGADIPEHFLEAYQTNFRFLVFPTSAGVPATQYRQRILFSPLSLEPDTGAKENANRVGGVPNWLLDDETPKSYGGTIPMFFLLQLAEELRFPIANDAPPQIELDLGGRPSPASVDYYTLFIGNVIYLFGTDDPNVRQVYAITQI